MISRKDVIDKINTMTDDPREIRYNPEDEMVYDKDGVLCSIDKFTDHIKSELHCNFEVILSDFMLNMVYRCKDCGAVIFINEDDYTDYNDLTCPCCGEYHKLDKSQYWTPEEIETDENKQTQIEWFKAQQKALDDYETWKKARKEKLEKKGKDTLFDDELCKKTYYGKTNMFTVSLKVNNLFYEKLKGLHLHISWSKRENKDAPFYMGYKNIDIPLSLYSVWLFWIFPHSRKYKEVCKV